MHSVIFYHLMVFLAIYFSCLWRQLVFLISESVFPPFYMPGCCHFVFIGLNSSDTTLEIWRRAWSWGNDALLCIWVVLCSLVFSLFGRNLCLFFSKFFSSNGAFQLCLLVILFLVFHFGNPLISKKILSFFANLLCYYIIFFFKLYFL